MQEKDYLELMLAAEQNRGNRGGAPRKIHPYLYIAFEFLSGPNRFCCIAWGELRHNARDSMG